MNFYWLIYLLLSYLIGSIPFALVIGKVFYHTDVRQFGSGNLGGTNAGRVLGKKAGVAVIACDLLKVVLAIAIVSIFDKEASIWAGLAAAIGHCYPVFANFKGGKAVATMFGILLSTSIFTFQDLMYFIIPVICFFIMLFATKMVSISSIIAALISSIYISFYQVQSNISIVIASWLLTILVIYRHRSNLVKIKNGTENKVKWLDRKKD